MNLAAKRIVDYHIHTDASSDGKGTMAEYISKAYEKQIAEIGFSDHIGGDQLKENSTFAAKMSKYVENFLICRKTSKVQLKLGSEIDYLPDEIDKIRRIVQKYPFDYVMGSVHNVGKWGVDNPAKSSRSRKDPLKRYDAYFTRVREMCRTRVFDVLGHPDLVKIFGLRPNSDISQMYEDAAQALSDAHMCAEINAKGLERPCREMFPNLKFLKILCEHAVPITFGSDAHNPDDLGLNLDKAIDLAKEAGYSEACLFTQRQKSFYLI